MCCEFFVEIAHVELKKFFSAMLTNIILILEEAEK